MSSLRRDGSGWELPHSLLKLEEIHSLLGRKVCAWSFAESHVGSRGASHPPITIKCPWSCWQSVPLSKWKKLIWYFGVLCKLIMGTWSIFTQGIILHRTSSGATWTPKRSATMLTTSLVFSPCSLHRRKVMRAARIAWTTAMRCLFDLFPIQAHCPYWHEWFQTKARVAHELTNGRVQVSRMCRPAEAMAVLDDFLNKLRRDTQHRFAVGCSKKNAKR